MTELLPAKATFAPGEDVIVEVRGPAPTVTLTHLGRPVETVDVVDGVAQFGRRVEGGYGVEAGDDHSALDVLADPLARPRYGFVSHYEAGRDPAGVAENARRLHLNAVQFYDWMYRHADLVPPADDYLDALGQKLSLESVRRLARALGEAGSLPLGYAAVYAAGVEEWPAWEDEGLYHADGAPWMLADFLWIVDPSSERWLAHLADDLRAALKVGFAGFHLDQYGAPKAARRLDGASVDLAEAFPALVDRVAQELRDARLIFNNVNDFPVWTTAQSSVDAVYIEVWPPHDRLGQLGRLIAKAQALAPAKAVILAAYLEPYANDEAGGRAAERLQLATVFSHGATALLHGEEAAVLTDPYYVRHACQSAESLESTRRFYDFAVRHGDLLFDRTAVDVTRSFLGGVNEELRIEAAVPVSVECDPGSLWARVTRGARGTLVHLIDLSPQRDDTWNTSKLPGRPLAGVRVLVERVDDAPVVLFAEPDDAPTLRPLTTQLEGRYDVLELPAFATWAMVWIPGGDEEVQSWRPSSSKG
jgi:dextranase